jgi:glycosyltransferase involved in cell wall biosynthesis
MTDVGVSILIPTFNRSRWLVKAVRSALHQSYGDLEVVVCDNASTDNTKWLMQDIVAGDRRVRYARSAKNEGPIANWWRCLELARGHFCVILSDDDFFIDPDYVSDGMQRLQQSRAGLLVTDCILGASVNTATNLGLPEFVRGDDFFLHFWDGPYRIPVISCIFDSEIARRCDPFADPDILYADIELWLKMMLLCDVVYRSKPSVFYRFHDSNIVHSLSFDAHRSNIRFIDRVYDFAKMHLERKEILDSWRSRMYRRYVLSVFLGECRRKGISAESFAMFAAELGSGVRLSYAECLRAYSVRRWLAAEVRRVGRRFLS